jgi:hypothetical protein
MHGFQQIPPYLSLERTYLLLFGYAGTKTGLIESSKVIIQSYGKRISS